MQEWQDIGAALDRARPKFPDVDHFYHRMDAGDYPDSVGCLNLMLKKGVPLDVAASIAAHATGVPFGELINA